MQNDRYPVRYVDCCAPGVTALFSGWYIQGNAARNDDGVGPFATYAQGASYVIENAVHLDHVYSQSPRRPWRIFAFRSTTTLQGV